MTNIAEIEILGMACKKYQQLEANAREAVAARNLAAEVEHITDIMQIVKRFVMTAPALAGNDNARINLHMARNEVFPNLPVKDTVNPSHYKRLLHLSLASTNKSMP